MRIHMTGGSPWGFKMTGGKDFRQPLAIGKVTPGSKADRAGVVEGHHILSVNGEDVRELPHFEAQSRIKAAKTALTLELSNVPVPKPTVPDISAPVYTDQVTSSYAPPNKSSAPTNRPSSGYAPTSKPYASSSNPQSYNSSSYSHSKSVSLPAPMSASRSPTAYSSPHTKTPSYEEKKNAPPDVEYRPVDYRDSQRRMYEEGDWNPSQSTQQSPSMQALLRSSGHNNDIPESEKEKITITAEIRDMILEEEEAKTNGHSAHDGSLRPTGVKVYEPEKNFTRPQSNPSPASYSTSPNSSYTRPPTNAYTPQQPASTKTQAVGNISKFLQTSGAKQGRPVFAKSLQDLQCPYGDPAVLEIRIGNTLPVPTVNWYHNERPVRESREKDIKFLNRGIVHTLVLGEFAPEFAGRYRCTLTNKHGSTSCNCMLNVEQLPAAYAQPSPTTYNNTSRGYQQQNSQPTSYQPRDNKPVVVSNSIGLYGQNTARETYAAQIGKRPSRDDQEEESEVLRALREEGEQASKPHIRSRSMRMLEETLIPESEDL